MTRNLNQFYVAGTSALKICEHEPVQIPTARIVKLPPIERVDAQGGGISTSTNARNRKSSANRFKTILDSSEMYCSLITEDFKGCRYNLFSKHNVQMLAAAGSAIASISLVFGV